MAADLAQDTSLGDECAYLLLTLVKGFWVGVCCAILFDIIQSGHTVLYVLMMTENNANTNTKMARSPITIQTQC